MFVFASERKIEREILREMVPVVYEHPNMAFESVLITLDYQQHSLKDILSYVPALKRKFREIKKSSSPLAEVDWIMGHLRKRAIGNVPLRELRAQVEKEIANG